jgi:3-methylfumaryl-CoA hydratase
MLQDARFEPAMNDDVLAQWVGRTEHRADRVTPVPLAALAATLGRDDPAPQDGSPIAPLRHWLYFLPLCRRSETGSDGHALRGGFLPPVPLPRRMWAGGRLEFHRPIQVGDAIERVSTIAKVDAKQGRSGALVFVRVRHEISAAGELAIVEEHDIVYRAAARAGDPRAPETAAPSEASWRREIVPDPVLLFRYSALTFNAHRIHYDWRYVTEVERYPGLIVHGPLIATLLADLARDHVAPAPIATFAFRAVMPLYDVAPFTVCGRRDAHANAVRLWAQDATGRLAMEATATLG